MTLNEEIPRLRDLLAATGRMKSRIIPNSQQPEVIRTPFPKPWQVNHPVFINFDRWLMLSQPQRDLIFMREVCWLAAVNVLKLDIYQGVTVAGLLGFLVELAQLDAIGMVAAGGLTAFAGSQIWRTSRGDQAEIEADEAAIALAQRRGYRPSEAAQALIDGMEVIARLENRPTLSLTELLRGQNLRLRLQGEP
jgi:hypothetical protein